MTDPVRPTPEEARRALDEAAGMRVVSEQDLRVLPRVLLGVGVAMAALLPLIKVTAGNPWALGIAMGAYVVALGFLMRWQRTASASPRGYRRRYNLGIAGTSAVYGLGCVAVAGAASSWPSTLILVVLTACPAVVAARSIERLGRV